MHASYGYDVRTEVFGANGSIAIGGLNRIELSICKENSGVCMPRTFLPEGKMPHFMLRFQEAYAKEMELFIQCVMDRTPSLVDQNDAVAAFKISLAAIESAGKKKPIEL